MKPYKVLIVEDELIIALSLKKELEQEGYQVMGVASSADDAVNTAREQKPDIILMDILLKGTKTGLEAAHEIVDFLKTKFIFLTGNIYMIDQDERSLNTDYSVLGKPVNHNELKDAIQIIFSGKS